MKRIYHPYTRWEDYNAGMWRSISKEEEAALLPKAVEFTGDAALYGSFMQRVVREWPFSCEHNLTDPSLNKRAWVGHAACCMAIGCPEQVTRKAWGMLTEHQRIEANLMADKAILLWRRLYEGKDRGIHQEVGVQVLFGWNT